MVLGRTKDGDLFALRDICPHRLAPLSAGVQGSCNGKPTIACPYHGWQFDVESGVCLKIPSLTEDQTMPLNGVSVTQFDLQEAHGLVSLFRSGDQVQGAPLGLPPLGQLGDRPNLVLSAIFESHIDHTTVGLMDPAHVGFVHNKWWWRPKSSGLRRKEKQFAPRDFGWSIVRHAPSTNSVAYRLLGRDVTTEIHYQLPGYRWEVIEGSKARIVTLSCLAPISDQATQMMQFTWWQGLGLVGLAKPLLRRWGREFLRQDQDILKLQAKNLPYGSRMLWIEDADRQAKWYQVLKREWCASQLENREFSNPVKRVRLSWMS